MTNHYLRAVMQDPGPEQSRDFLRFVQEEMDSTAQRLESIENDDGFVSDDQAGRWNYEKGRLDAMRLLFGLQFQSYTLHAHGDPLAPDEDR